MRSLHRPLALVLGGIWLPVGILIVWWFASSGSSSISSPPLERILRTFRRDWLPGPKSLIGSDLVPSLQNLALGFGIAVCVGIAFGVLFAQTRSIWSAVRPSVELARITPAVIFLPLVIAVFRLSSWGKVALIAYVATWPVLWNTIEGIQGIDPLLAEVAASLHLRRREKWLTVVLRAASPQIMTGVRVAAALAVTMVVASEYYAADRGVGHYILNSQQVFNSTSTWAGTIVLGLIGYLLSVVLRLIGRRVVLTWHFDMRRSQAGPATNGRRDRRSSAIAPGPQVALELRRPDAP